MTDFDISVPWDRMPPALRGVIAALRYPSDGDGERLIEACRRVEDWDGFLWWTERHRVAPLVRDALRRAAWPVLPETVQAALEGECRRNALKSLRLAGETIRLARLLEENGVQTMPLKGQVLALTAYGAMDRRHAGDVDVLISPEDVERAHEILRGQGYVSDMAAIILRTPGRHKAALRGVHHFEYRSPNGGRVELHWQLSSAVPLSLPFSRLWAGKEVVRLGGHDLRMLPRDVELIFLCNHGAGHAWFRLKWLCDIARLQSGLEPQRWERLLADARALGVFRPVLQAVVLAHALLGAPLPDEVRAQAAKVGVLPYLVRAAVDALADPEIAPQTIRQKVAAQRYRLSLTASWRHKGLLLAQLMSHAEDWGVLSLPDRLFFLYYPARPFLWLARQFGRRTSGQDLSTPSVGR